MAITVLVVLPENTRHERHEYMCQYGRKLGPTLITNQAAVLFPLSPQRAGELSSGNDREEKK